MNAKALFALPFISLVLYATILGNGISDNLHKRLENYFPEDIINYYGNLEKDSLKTDPDRYRWDGEPPSIKFIKELSKISKGYLGVIYGGTPLCELVIFDTLNNFSVIGKIRLDIPGKHVNLGDIMDINADGHFEIRINMSAGAHGFYSSFLTFMPDSMAYIQIQGEGDKFVALTGGIEPEDLNGDGVYEIIADEMPMPWNLREYVVYKWNGEVYYKMESVIVDSTGNKSVTKYNPK